MRRTNWMGVAGAVSAIVGMLGWAACGEGGGDDGATSAATSGEASSGEGGSSGTTTSTDSTSATTTGSGGSPGFSCDDPAFPVHCPMIGDVPEGCWGDGTVCSTIKDCGDAAWACGSALLEVDCLNETCECPDSDYPVYCPPHGGADEYCWSPGVVCSSVIDCGGEPHACTSDTLEYDCSTDSCVSNGSCAEDGSYCQTSSDCCDSPCKGDVCRECIPEDKYCSSTSECCSGLTCDFGSCKDCLGYGEHCSSSSQCCGYNTCESLNGGTWHECR